jgi:hypothetical protein
VAERWVRPPVVAREPAPAWIAVWRFRVLALLVLALLVVAGVVLFRQFTGANAQDPGVGALAHLLR